MGFQAEYFRTYQLLAAFYIASFVVNLTIRGAEVSGTIKWQAVHVALLLDIGKPALNLSSNKIPAITAASRYSAPKPATLRRVTHSAFITRMGSRFYPVCPLPAKIARTYFTRMMSVREGVTAKSCNEVVTINCFSRGSTAKN